jgi:hypothetical protein
MSQPMEYTDDEGRVYSAAYSVEGTGHAAVVTVTCPGKPSKSRRTNGLPADQVAGQLLGEIVRGE